MVHRSFVHRLGPAVLVTGALLLAACGGDSPSATTPSADADVTVHALTKLTFDQDAYTAAAGDVVIDYVNDSSIVHNLHVVDAAGNDVGSVLDVAAQGQVDQGTYPLTAGTYTLLCKIAGHGTMKATLTVS